ncbi:hypothetical protein KA078_00055 [Candidatus Woesebacteria bacterium]|nr:hypothetical protein [Candidatus Woesebacteria bacterium]
MSQITYIPYIPLQKDTEIDFGGGLVVWHFNSLAEQKIPDPATRNFIKNLLDANVEGSFQKKIEGIGVVSIGDTDFRAFSTEEMTMVQEVKLLLFLCRISRSNTTILGTDSDGWSLATSENFEPVYQNFQIGNDHISESAGYIINMGIGGYTVSEKKFYKPSHVVISAYGMGSFDNELFKQLLKARKRRKKLLRRILRATDLLFQAYYNSTNVSRNARILLIAAAFETLLDLLENARKYFKEEVERRCDLPKEPRYRHYFRTRNGIKRDKNRSMKVLWADSFFDLRNQIVHGSIVPEEMYQFRNTERHLDISILFFLLLVKSLLNEGMTEKTFWDTIEWKQRDNNSAGFQYEDHAVAVSISKAIKRAYSKSGEKSVVNK